MFIVVIVCLNVFPVGEKKLGRVITPDTWKDGARNTTGYHSTVSTHKHMSACLDNISADFLGFSAVTAAICFAESGGRKINENKMLTSKKARYGYSVTSLVLRMLSR